MARKRRLTSYESQLIYQAMEDVEDAYEVVRKAWMNLARTISPSNKKRGLYYWFVRFHWRHLPMNEKDRLKCMVDLLHIAGLSVADVFPDYDTSKATQKQVDALRKIGVEGRNLTYAQAERRIYEHNRKEKKSVQRNQRDKNRKRVQ